MANLMEDLVLGEEHALCEKTEEISIKKLGKPMPGNRNMLSVIDLQIPPFDFEGVNARRREKILASLIAKSIKVSAHHAIQYLPYRSE
jgi:hypothetical protein